MVKLIVLLWCLCFEDGPLPSWGALEVDIRPGKHRAALYLRRDLGCLKAFSVGTGRSHHFGAP